MEQSESIAELASALAIAQGAMMNAPRTQVNPAFKSSYADLASVWDACRKPLSDNGLAVVQTTEGMVDGNITIITELLHGSDQWIRGRLTVPVRGRPVAQGRAEPDAQAIGSAITYARRYALAAMVGIAPEDDDGEAAKDAGNAPAMEAAPLPRKRTPLLPSPKPSSPLVQAAVEMGATVEPRSEDDMALWANEDRTPDQREELIALLAKNDLTNQWLADEGYWTVPAKPISRAGAYRAIVRLQQMPAV